MLSHRIEYPPQVDQPLSIQSQRFYGGAPGGRQSDDPGEILVPGEMVPLSLPSGMVQWHNLIVYGVTSFGLGVLIVVATLASQRKIAY